MTTQNPATRTASLLAARAEHVARGVGNAHPIVVARAEGARMWDVDGNELIDFVGGIGVLNVGHNHPRVVQAVREQLERVSHTCFQVGMYEPYIRLAERLCAVAPGAFPKKALFVTTGAEATENAVKIARAYTGRPGIVAFANSFHGRTLMGMTLTGKANPYRQNFGPFAPEVYHAPYPYEYWGVNTKAALEGLQELFDTEVSPDRVAALIIEPQLGEGGFVPAPAAFLRSLRALTQKHGIVLIDDEIQTGIGRTGKFWAIEYSGIEPDLICFAKSIGGGLPIAGVLGRAGIMDAPLPGGLGGTFAGNPLACAAGLAVLEIFEEEGLLEKGQRLGEILHEGFRKMQSRFPQIGDVRGLGPMAAMELVKDPASKEPDPVLTGKVFDAARERGLLLMKAGMHYNVIRCLVPLVVSEAELHKGLEILEQSFEAATA
jgi:4-aminobutyrate aminotransferase/(S)-3-amino-2-methylpropionate transaminase